MEPVLAWSSWIAWPTYRKIFFRSAGREVGIDLHQIKQGVCEVRINNNAVLWMEINGRSKPSGAYKLVCVGTDRRSTWTLA